MQIDEAIAAADLTRANELERELKERWLASLEGQLRAELYAAHGSPPRCKPGALSVPPPWDELYVRWLVMRIDLEQGEITRYNNSARLYDAAYKSFAAHYARTHTPKGTAKLKF